MKQKLIETFNKDWEEKSVIYELPLNESSKILEVEGNKYSVLGAYRVPIWRLDKKNLNGRVYSSSLAEKVIKESKITYALDGHPEDNYDPVYEDVKAVGKNPTKINGILYSDCYFVDEDFYKKAKRILEAGAGIGLSSSSWGDVDDKGNVLIEEFEIERYFDFVLNPSYEVFLTKENQIIQETITNNNSKEVEKVEETIPNIKEKKVMSSVMLEERNLKLGVKNLFDKAEKQSTLKEKINTYKEIVEYCDGIESATEYSNQAKQKIQEFETQVHVLAEKGKEVIDSKVEESLVDVKTKLEESTKQINLLENKLEIATTALDKFKERELNLKEMYDISISEKNSLIDATEYKELHAFTEELQIELDQLRHENLLLKKKLRVIRQRQQEGAAFRAKPSHRFLKPQKVKEDDMMMPAEDEYFEDEIVGEPELMVNPYEDDFEYNSNIEPEFMNTDEVLAYYEDLELENPNVKKIKERLMKCKTVFEAQKVYLNLKDFINVNKKPLEVKKSYEPSVTQIKRKGWK